MPALFRHAMTRQPEAITRQPESGLDSGYESMTRQPDFEVLFMQYINYSSLCVVLLALFFASKDYLQANEWKSEAVEWKPEAMTRQPEAITLLTKAMTLLTNAVCYNFRHSVATDFH